MLHPLASRSVTRLLALTLSLLCLLSGTPAARSARAFAAPPAAPQAGETHNIRKISLVTKDLVLDRTTQTIYGSVPGTESNGNSITPINAVSGTVGASVFIGSEPGDLAISDNGQVIYAALDGAKAIRRFDVPTQTPGLQFNLGRDQFGLPVAPVHIKVAPGAPETLAVQGGGSEFDSRLFVFDGGVQRGNSILSAARSMEFSTSPTRLYTSTDRSSVTGNVVGIQRINLTAGGPVTDGNASSAPVVSGEVRFDNGRLYTASGRVFDPETGALLGTFSAPDISGFNSTVVPDSSVGRVYFVSSCCADATGRTTITLRAFDMNTFLPVGSVVIPDATGQPTSLMRWGANGLAFRTQTGVYLIQTTLVPSSEPVPTPTPTPSPTPAPTPAVTPTPLPGELREVALRANDLVVDPNTQTIYASVPSSAGTSGNSIIPVSPVAASTGAPVFVGSEPTRMAISDNGQFIYVALEGSERVRRFDVQTQTAGLQFALDAATTGVQVGDMEVAPGHPETVAIARVRRGSSPSSFGVAVFDNGVMRPRIVGSPTFTTDIEYSGSPEVLYGFDGDSSGRSFHRFGVGPCGVSRLASTPSLFFGSPLNAKFANGRIYLPSGLIIDPEAGNVAGQLSGTGVFPLLVLPDPQAGRVYILGLHDSQPNMAKLRVYDMNTLLLVGALDIPGIGGGTVGPDAMGSLVRWGTNGLAFRAMGKIFLLQNSLIGGTSGGVTPAPTPATPTVTLSGQITDFNGPLSGVTVNVSGSQTTSVVTDAEGRYTIPNVRVCDALTLTPSKPTYTFSPPSINVTNALQPPSLNFTALPLSFSLGQSVTFTNEGVGRIVFTVTRGGDPSVANEVSYETGNLSASDTSDYTAAYGTLRFAPGELSKQVEVLITDDVFVEGAEAFTFKLTNPTGGAILHPMFSSVFVALGDNDTTPPTTSPLSNARFFVRRHYHDFLNRDPANDPTGFNFWVDQLAACDSDTDAQKKGICLEERRINVSAAFFLSIEFQQTGYFVHRFYTASFPDSASRPKGLPRFKEFLRDTQEIGLGVIVGQGSWKEQLEENKQAFARRWVERAEFQAQHPQTLTPEQFVDALFANSGATPTAAERAAAIAAYASGGTQGRASALRSVVESGSVYNRQYNSAFVLMQYFGYLRRNPNDAPDNSFGGYEFWLAKLNEFSQPGEDVRDERVALLRVRRADMVKSFLVSGEYMARFGPQNFNIRQ